MASLWTWSAGSGAGVPIDATSSGAIRGAEPPRPALPKLPRAQNQTRATQDTAKASAIRPLISKAKGREQGPRAHGILDEGNGVTERVSIDSFGLEGHGASHGAYNHTISDDGRLVVFHSDASNLVPGDTNGVTDVFTHDLLSGLTERVSVDSSGLQFSTACSAPALSSDGGVVAFRKQGPQTSAAVFGLCVRDRATGSTQQITSGFYSSGSFWSHERWSQWATTLGFPALSADGLRVAYTTALGSTYTYDGWPSSEFHAEATGSLHVFDRSRQTRLTLATYESWNFSTESQALAWAPFYAPALSDDGWRLAFESDSPGLVAGDTNGVRDAFVLEIPGGPTRPRIGRRPASAEGVKIRKSRRTGAPSGTVTPCDCRPGPTGPSSASRRAANRARWRAAST